MRERDIVKHTARPEWGLGVVVTGQADRHCEVLFEDHGRVKLALGLAESKLHVVPTADVPSTSGLLDPARWPEVERRATASRCEHCREPLHESRWDPSDQWKSCPACSRRDGHQHLFHPYPDAYDAYNTSVPRPTHASPEGSQSNCQDCRRKGRRPRLTARTCRDVTPPLAQA
jgi:Protein of unknown function (DUF3553)